MVVPLVIVVGLLGGEAAVSGAVLGGAALAFASVAAIIVAGRTVVRPLMRLAAATREPRAGAGDRDVHRGRHGADHGRARPVAGARRLPRRHPPRRERIPPPPRGRYRAVQGPAARPLLHDRRHERRPVRADRRAGPLGRVRCGGLRAQRRRRLSSARASSRWRHRSPTEAAFLLAGAGEFAFVILAPRRPGAAARPRYAAIRGRYRGAFDAGDSAARRRRTPRRIGDLGAAHEPRPWAHATTAGSSAIMSSSAASAGSARRSRAC